jgi:hypothetical protein
MQVFFDTILSPFNTPVAGAQVFVYQANGTLATIYDANVPLSTTVLDSSGAAYYISEDLLSPISNPIVTGADGKYLFFAANGVYTVTIVSAGYDNKSFEITLNDPSVSPFIPTLGIADGGTNMTSVTTGGVVYASSASALATGSVLTFDGALLSVNGVNVGLGAGSVSTNTAVGSSALNANTTGANNTAVGFQSLVNNNTGGLNVGVGRWALRNNEDGSSNTAVGTQALSLNTTGTQNTTVGAAAGGTVNGSRNTIVGYLSRTSSGSGDDQTVVGEGLVGKGNDTAFIGGTNGAYNEKNVTTWETTSDMRLKKNIVDNTDGLQKILAIRVRNFEYCTPEEITELPETSAVNKAGVQIGVVAQEMLPECVSETSVGVKSVNTDPLVWYLVNAVKQLAARIEELEK